MGKKAWEKHLADVEIERLSREVELDPKTGLLNYPAFKKKAQERISSGVSEGRRPIFSLLLADLDDFKQINTLLGYQATDEFCLLPAAEAVKEFTKRPGDVASEAGRFGGEEFVMLLEGTDTLGAVTVAQRLQQKINDLSFATPHGRQNVGVTIGLTTLDVDGSYEQAFNEANQCLQEAKNIEGKNRIAIAGMGVVIPQA